MVVLRGEIAALSKQVERLSRDPSRNRSRTRYGHLVTQQGTKPLPDKVEPILNYPKPKTIKELQRFLGILNFFRRFLPNVAQHQIALSEFLKGTRKNDNRFHLLSHSNESRISLTDSSVSSVVVNVHLDRLVTSQQGQSNFGRTSRIRVNFPPTFIILGRNRVIFEHIFLLKTHHRHQLASSLILQQVHTHYIPFRLIYGYFFLERNGNKMNILAQKSIRTPLSHWSKLDLVKAGMSRDGRNLNELKEDRTSRIRGNQNELKATRTRRAGENWIIGD
ncbi:hypothetical protein NPIL_349583 [Nephila pilipes]|uniref:Reverse transcriptase n=1 Tax=Nephila pilipes TaxID=299642 RepID=A0A8X6PKH5_NEPPI|nr:hypothetical protein NPIL_349583 [Nephila pilipes]